MTARDLGELKAELLEDLRSEMANCPVSYRHADVVRCGAILDAFLDTACQACDTGEYLAAVERAVLELNTLHVACGHGLIETIRREILCELFDRAGTLRGFAADDIAGRWRKW